MQRRFSEISNEGADNWFNDQPYPVYDIQKPLFDNDHHFYLNEISVKKEEDVSFPDELCLQDAYQSSTLVDCLSMTLKMPFRAIQQISQTNPLGFHRLIERAKRVLRREKAKLRNKLRCKDEPIKLEETEVQVAEEKEKVRKPAKVGKQQKLKRKATQISKEESEPTHSECHLSTSDGQTENEKQQKKLVQMIRNRISAQNSRDRKKAYIQQLEATTCSFERQNIQLQQKMKELHAQTEQIQRQNSSLRKQLEEVKNTFFKDPQQKPTFGRIGLTLLTLVSVFMMMGKCSEADSGQLTYPVEFKQAESLLSTDFFSDLEPALHKKGGALNVSDDLIDEKALMKRMNIVKSQMRELLSEKYFQPSQTTLGPDKAIDSFIE